MKNKKVFFIFIFISFLLNFSCNEKNNIVKFIKIQNNFENDKAIINLDILDDNQIIKEFKFSINENPYIYRQNQFSKEIIYFNVFKLFIKSKKDNLKVKFLDIQIKDFNNNFIGVFYNKDKLIKLFESES